MMPAVVSTISVVALVTWAVSIVRTFREIKRIEARTKQIEARTRGHLAAIASAKAQLAAMGAESML